MPVYGFVCDCGQRSQAEFSMNDPEKQLLCPWCGAWMGRDYSGIRIGGDLPSRWNYYDPILGRQIESKADRQREMDRRGLVEYTPDPLVEPEIQEIRYINKHASKVRGIDREEKHKRVKELERKAGRKRRERAIDANLPKAWKVER